VQNNYSKKCKTNNLKSIRVSIQYPNYQFLRVLFWAIAAYYAREAV
jgi:hypothetical protein